MKVEKRKISHLIHRHKYIDGWFPFRYSLDVYSGCQFGCIYCRANAEKEKTVIIKENILEILEKELADIPEGSLIGVGGGINDSYQPLEEEEKLARAVLRRLMKRGHIPFILTKSILLERDLDMFMDFPPECRPVITMSLAFPEDITAEKFEPGLPSSRSRLRLIRKLRERKLSAGLCVMPLAPDVNDSHLMADIITDHAAEQDLDFVLINRLSSDTFDWLSELPAGYDLGKIRGRTEAEQVDEIFSDNIDYYYSRLRTCKLLPMLPRKLFHGRISVKDETAAVLSHIHYLKSWLDRKRDAFRFASYAVNKCSEKEFIDMVESGSLQRLSGIGPHIEKMVTDMVKYDDFSEYDKTVAMWREGEV